MAKERNIGDVVILNGKNSTDLQRTKIRNIGKTVVLQDKRDVLDKRSDILLSAPIVDRGKLKFDEDKIAQASGFFNKSEMNSYKMYNTDLFEGMDGIKHIEAETDLSGAPYVTKYDSNYAKNLSDSTVEKIVQRFNDSDVAEIDDIMGTLNTNEWQDTATMKKYSDKVKRYVNDRVVLDELGYFNSISEDDRKRTLEGLKEIEKYVNTKKDWFANFKNSNSYEKIKDVVVLPASEQLELVRNYWSANNKYDEINAIISDVQKLIANSPTPDNTENIDESIDFFVNWYKENNTFTGAREAYGISKGYVSSSGKYSKEKEKNSILLDQAMRKATLEVKFGDEKYVKERNEDLQEYWENSNTTKDFSKYYTEMQNDPEASDYIRKGKQIYKDKNPNVTDEEREVVYYYLGKGDKDNYYFTWLEDTVYKREVAAGQGWAAVTDGKSLKQHRFWSDYTKDAPLEANASSVLLNLGSGAEYAYNTLSGNTKESKLSEAGLKIREAQSNKRFWEGPLGVDLYDFLYNTAMSGVDSVAAMSLGKGAAATLALSAAAAGVNDALKRGLDERYAFWNGLMSGVFECLFEEFSIERLEKLKKSKGAGFKTFIKNLGKTMVTNASEEAATEFANIVYDTIFNGDVSNYVLSLQQYIDEGLSEEEAKKKVRSQFELQIFEAAASGGLMGVGFGIMGNTSAAINAARYGKNYYGATKVSIYALVKNGLAMPEGSDAYNQAIRASKKLKNGYNLAGAELYNLATAIEGEIERKSALMFAKIGVDKEKINELAPLVAKAVFGENLNSSEMSLLKKSEIAIRVVNELSADSVNTVWKDSIRKSYSEDDMQSMVEDVNEDELNDLQLKNGDNTGIMNSNLMELTKEQQAAVLKYNSGEEYKINAKLRGHGQQDAVLSTARKKHKVSNKVNDAISNDEVAFFAPENNIDYVVNDNQVIWGLSDKEESQEFSQEYVENLMDSFKIEKLSDYIHVQKRVMETLEKEGFFTDKENRCTKVVNDASGMIVEINKKGIKETFDLENYVHIGRNKKIAKLAIIRYLVEIIKYGELVRDNVKNIHKGTETNKNFAYLRHTINIDGKAVTVQLDIKKSPEKNKFRVHKIIKINSANNLPDNVEAIKSGHVKVSAEYKSANNLPDNVKAIKSGHIKVSATKNSLSQNNNDVNKENNILPMIENVYRDEKKFDDDIEVLQLAQNGVVDSVKNYNYNKTKEGEKYGGKNTELLERGRISATRRGDNILRKTSTNSAKLAACLGVSQRKDRTFSKSIWAGESDWFDRKSTQYEKTRERFDKGILREIRGVRLSGYDTIGGTVSSRILEEFKDTICKDEKGNLISLYHWTNEIFDEFQKGELGFHFGTLQAAYDRYLHTNEEKPNAARGFYKEVVLNIENPIEMSDGKGEWTVDWVAFQLMRRGVIGEQEYERLQTTSGFYENTYDNPAAKIVRNMLAKNGYDGIIYKNLSEDVGSYSVIALYPEQIIIVAENGILKENSGISRVTGEKLNGSIKENKQINKADSVSDSAFLFNKPIQKFNEPSIDSIEVSEETKFLNGLTGNRWSKIQMHIVDLCKKLNSDITVEFSDELESNGTYIRNENKILLKSDLSVSQMYVEVFKHEFMHSLETKHLYSKFLNYCYEGSKAFEQYVRAELKLCGMDIDKLTRVSALEEYTAYKYEQYKNIESIPKYGRDLFLIEDARKEIVADFFAEVLFQGEKYRNKLVMALENTDASEFVGIGDEISSEAALLELMHKEHNLFEKIILWIKDIVNKLRGLLNVNNLIYDLNKEINYLERMIANVYQSKEENGAVNIKTRNGYNSVNKFKQLASRYWYPNMTKSEIDLVKKTAKRELNTTNDYIDNENKWLYNKLGYNIYTEEQYNNFGWVRYNEVLTAREYKILLSRYADYMHNNDRYPTTRFGEAVIHSSECPDVLMYVKGDIACPRIIKVVMINLNEPTEFGIIREEILSNEYKQDSFPFSFIEKYYGQEVLVVSKARDYAPYRGFEQRFIEGGDGQEGDPIGRTKRYGRGSVGENKRISGADSVSESAFSFGTPSQKLRDNPSAYAKHLVDKYNSNADSDKIGGMIEKILNNESELQEETLQEVYDYNGEYSGELSLKERLINEIAVEISEGVIVPRDEYADEVISFITEDRLCISKSQGSKIRRMYGTLTAYCNTLGVKLRVTGKPGFDEDYVLLDDAWVYWSDGYPELFNNIISSDDMPARLAEIMEYLKGLNEEVDYEGISRAIVEELYGIFDNMENYYENQNTNEIYREFYAEMYRENTALSFETKAEVEDIYSADKEPDILKESFDLDNTSDIIHKSIDRYTKQEYEYFGWAIYNEVLTTQELEFLTDDYTKFKRNNNKDYPITKFGEVIINSNECPDVLMYVKGYTDNPLITKIVRIDHDNVEEIKEDILFAEYEQDIFALTSAQNIYDESITINKAMDEISYWEYQRQLTKKKHAKKDAIIKRAKASASALKSVDRNKKLNDESNETIEEKSKYREYCFVKCKDYDKIALAEKMESEGKDNISIWRELNIFRGIFGDWIRMIGADRFAFFVRGDARRSWRPIKQKVPLPNGNIEGKLYEFIRWKELFRLFPKFKDTKVRIVSSPYDKDTVKFSPSGNVLIINKKYCDEFVKNRNQTVRIHLIREIQRMIQFEEGKYIGKSYEYWKKLEENGELPFFEELNRTLTADDMMKYFIDNYEAEMAAKMIMLSSIVKRNSRWGIKPVKELFLYEPNIEPDIALAFDENGNLVTVRESDIRTGENKFVNFPKNNFYWKLLRKEDIDEESVRKANLREYYSRYYDEELFDAAHNLEASNSNVGEYGETTMAVKNFVASGQKRLFRQQAIRGKADIRGGNSGFLKDKEQLVYENEENTSHIELDITSNYFKSLLYSRSVIPIAENDTIGRKIDVAIQKELVNTILKNNKGEPISLYVINKYGKYILNHERLGIVVGTVDMAVEKYKAENNEKWYKITDVCEEYYANIKKPLILPFEPYEFSVNELGFWLTEEYLISREEYFYLLDKITQKSSPKYYNFVFKKLRSRLKDFGYDSIIYANQNYDAGSLAVIVFDKEQLIPVAQNGIVIDDSGIIDNNYEVSNLQTSGAVVNTQLMQQFALDNAYIRRKYRKSADIRIKAGSSDWFEKGNLDTQDMLYEKVMNNIIGKAELEYNKYASSLNREFDTSSINKMENTVFKTNEGDFISFYIWSQKEITPHDIVRKGVEIKSFNGAFGDFIRKKQESKYSYNGIFYEYILNSINPLILRFENWNTEDILNLLYKDGKITQKFYEEIMTHSHLHNPKYTNHAAKKVRAKIEMLGYDSIVFVKESGECAVLALDENQLLSVAKNGILIENNGITQEGNSKDDELFFEESLIESVVIDREDRTFRNIEKMKSVVPSLSDNTEKMLWLTEYLACTNDPIKENSSEIKVGHSGALENKIINIWAARKVIDNLVHYAQNKEVARIDTGGREISDEIRRKYKKTIFKDSDGRLLSLFVWSKYSENKYMHSAFPYNMGSLMFARNNYLTEKEKHPNITQGFYEEYYANIKNPYLMISTPKEISVRAVVDDMYANGILSKSEYRIITTREGVNWSGRNNNSAKKLKEILSEKKIDAIVYLDGRNNSGSLGVIIIDESNLYPVTRNGIIIGDKKYIEKTTITI